MFARLAKQGGGGNPQEEKSRSADGLHLGEQPDKRPKALAAQDKLRGLIF